MFDPKSLTAEKSLLDIFKQCRYFQTKKFNNIVTCVVFIILCLFAYLSNQDIKYYLQAIRSISEIGFNFFVGMLGFLIAGFTIFATLSDKELFVAMAKVPHKKSGLNYLKYSFFSFMYVFIIFIVFGFMCLIIILLCDVNGPAALAYSSMFGNYDLPKTISVKVFFVLFLTYLFYLLVVLKAFVFNVYHIVMASIRFEIEFKNNQE